MSPTGFLFVDSEHDQSYELAQILLITAKVQTQKLTRVSAMVVVLYDMMLTMDKEIEFFWKQRWSTVKLIYMLNRYGGLFFVLVDTWGSVTDYRTDSFCAFCLPSCTFQFYFQQWTGWISVLLVEIILIIRVNTLYERSRKSTVLLAFFFVIQAGIMAAVLSIFDSVTEIFVWVAVNTCGSYEAPPKWVAIFWLPPVIMDFGLLVLTFRKALAIRRMMPGNNWRDFQLHRTLVRDQALYFTGILICSLTNMAFLAFSSSLLCDALGFALGFPCVMGSRILLNLRETARGKPMTSLALTSLRFADNPGMQPVGLSGEISLPEDNDDDDSLPTSFESTGLFEDII